MPIKRIIHALVSGFRLLVSILCLLAILVIISGLAYRFTNDKTTDAIAAAVLTLVVVVLGPALRSHIHKLGSTRRRRAILSIFVIGAVAVYLASCANAATTGMSGGNKFGGYAWSKSVTEDLGYAAIPNCGWAKVWHNGYAIVGGYKDYKFSLTVHNWCWTARMVHSQFGPILGWEFVGHPTFTYGFEPGPTAEWDGLMPYSTVSRWETCWIKDVKTPRGCYRIVIQAQIKHLVPLGFFPGGPDGHPKLTIVVNARGVVTYVDDDLNKWFPW